VTGKQRRTARCRHVSDRVTGQCWVLNYLDVSIEAPPSVVPHRHLCDITGLEVRTFSLLSSPPLTLPSQKAPYTDPATGIRYHDKSVYEIVKGLVSPSLVLLLPVRVSTTDITLPFAADHEYSKGLSI
jgi:hypothetical protein